jgi:thermostable 8-oxoguanine DNA glycosylase
MVVAKCRLKLKSQTRLRREKQSKLNLESLKGDETRRKYQEVINKNLDVKSGQDSRTWEGIKDVIQRAAEESIEQIKNVRNRWYNEECRAVVEERSSVRVKYILSCTQEMKTIYETRRKICKR